MATKRQAEKALAAKYPSRSTWVEGKHTYDGYRVTAWLGGQAAFCLPTRVATAREQFAPESWAALIKKL